MKKKNLYITNAILMIVSIIGFIVSSFLFELNKNLWWTLLISAILFLVFLVLTCVFYFPNAEFICSKCNKQFKPTISKSMIAIHFPTRRYLKCPHCNKTSWCKETWDFKL